MITFLYFCCIEIALIYLLNVPKEFFKKYLIVCLLSNSLINAIASTLLLQDVLFLEVICFFLFYFLDRYITEILFYLSFSLVIKDILLLLPFYEDDFKRLLTKIEKDEAESNKQYLVDEKNNQYIRYVDICYIQSHRNMCTFFTIDHEYQQYITLKRCAETLCKNIAFYKINSYTIINFKYVTKINSQSVTLSNRQTFNVSRQSKDIVEKYHAYRRYLQ